MLVRPSESLNDPNTFNFFHNHFPTNNSKGDYLCSSFNKSLSKLMKIGFIILGIEFIRNIMMRIPWNENFIGPSIWQRPMLSASIILIMINFILRYFIKIITEGRIFKLGTPVGKLFLTISFGSNISRKIRIIWTIKIFTISTIKKLVILTVKSAHFQFQTVEL